MLRLSQVTMRIPEQPGVNLRNAQYRSELLERLRLGLAKTLTPPGRSSCRRRRVERGPGGLVGVALALTHRQSVAWRVVGRLSSATPAGAAS
jgi:hypothetical protein